MRKYSELKKIIKAYRLLSNGISYILHPLAIPTYLFIALGFFSPLSLSPLNTPSGVKFIIGAIFLSTFFMPLLIIFLLFLLKNKHWSTQHLQMNNKDERVFPFMIIGIYFTVLTYFIRATPYLNEVVLIIVGSTSVSILLVSIISKFWKISAHATGISAMIGILGVINNSAPDAILFFPITILIILAGCLLSARLYLNTHTPMQILGGFLLGLTMGLMGYFFI